MNLEGVAVLHIKGIWRVRWLNARPIEKKSDGAWCLALSFAEGVHQLLKLSCALDLEEDLVVVVGDLDIKVLRWGGLLVLIWWCAWGATVIVGARHCEEVLTLKIG